MAPKVTTMISQAQGLRIWLILCAILPLVLADGNSNGLLKKVFVDLPALPDPFDNAKLPIELSGATECHQLMGCFEPLPIASVLTNPLTMETKFEISTKNKADSVIKFELVENCLKSRPEECRLYPFNLQSLLESPYEPWKRTIILVSGYQTKPPVDWEVGAKRIWLELEDVNIITADWSASNSGWYPVAATNTRLVARQITLLLYYLAKLSGLEVGDDSFAEKIYMVGHSLGAHISGFVGTDLGGAIGRITGLDPAGPNFDQLHERFRLDRNDAQLVDAIHSNGGAVIFSTRPRFGTAQMSGHIDLYANDGSHQPGCTSDMLGCSHGKSNKYYMAFLQHELSMRNYLNDNYTSLYRLNAYASDHYDNFQNATGLLNTCPSSVASDHDLFSSDLDSCAIPVDYFTWFSHVREELETRHNIDFSRESRKNNSFYFYTGAETNDQMDHYLVKVRISKRNAAKRSFLGRLTSKRAQSYRPDECDVSFDIQMKNGFDNKYLIEQYRMLQDADHYKIIAPFLSTNVVSKYKISKLDADDYGLVGEEGAKVVGDEDKLREELRAVFPESVMLTGYQVGEKATETSQQEKKDSGFFKNIFNNIWNMAKGRGTGDEASKKLDGVSCDLNINYLAVRPLRRFHRNMVAYYSLELIEDVKYPKIVLLGEGEKFSDHIDPKYEMPSAQNTRLYLDSVFIGPYDKTLIGAPKPIDYDEILPTDGNAYVKHTSSQVSPVTWITLTSFLIVIIIALAAASSVRIRKVDAIDKQALLMCSVSTISYPAEL